MAPRSHLILTLFIVIISFCYSHHFAEHSDRVRRYFYSSPIKTELNKDEKAREAVRTLLSHFSKVGDEMYRLRNISYGSTGLQDLCNVVDKRIRPQRVAQRLRMFGFSQFKSSCITDLKIGDPLHLVRNILSLVRGLQKGTDNLSQLGPGWNNSFLPFGCYYRSFAQDCTLFHTPALRVNSSWALLTSIIKAEYAESNITKDRTIPYIEELIKWEKDGLRNVLLNTGKQVNATSVESMWGGRDAASVFEAKHNSFEYKEDHLPDNPAIKAMLSFSSKWSQQVESSFNIANIVTMSISCLLVFIPISFFHEAKLQAVFFYVLLTDIFACAPLAIKGSELIHFSKYSFGEIRTRVYGLDSQLDDGAAELSIVVCSAPRNVYWTGFKFVAFAVSAMVLGIGLEVFMLIRIRRRNKRERSNKLPDHWWEANAACAECFCQHSSSREGSRGVYASRRLLSKFRGRIYR